MKSPLSIRRIYRDELPEKKSNHGRQPFHDFIYGKTKGRNVGTKRKRKVIGKKK